MKKPVPDPPSHMPRFTTAHTQFGHCQDNQKPLFAVCAGVDIEDALIHLSMTLQSTHETNLQVCELADRTVGDLAWRSCQSLEISRALVRSLLDGIAGQRGGRSPRGKEKRGVSAWWSCSGICRPCVFQSPFPHSRIVELAEYDQKFRLRVFN